MAKQVRAARAKGTAATQHEEGRSTCQPAPPARIDFAAGGHNYYTYDADSKRVSQQTADGFREFIYQGPNMLALQMERDESETTVAQYTMGERLEAMWRSGTSSFYHYNHLGTTLALTGANEAVTDTYQHDAWGVLLGSTGATVNPHTYVGQQRYYRMPTADLYHLGFRDYAQRLGRFTTVDPARDGENWYGYVADHPTNAIDPRGLLAPIVVGGIVVGVFAYLAHCALNVALPRADEIHKDGQDKVAHCVFHCKFTRCIFPIANLFGSAACAWSVGAAHEYFWQKLGAQGVWDPADIAANTVGVMVAYHIFEDCEQGCRKRLP